MQSYSLFDNPAVDWLSFRGAWAYQVLTIGFFYVVISAVLPSSFFLSAWEVTFTLHTVAFFFFFHWIKGTPTQSTVLQGKHDQETVWEQIDRGVQNTSTRKFLIVVPLLMFVTCIQSSDYHLLNVVWDLNLLAWAVVPKLSSMHGVRLFGWNN